MVYLCTAGLITGTSCKQQQRFQPPLHNGRYSVTINQNYVFGTWKHSIVIQVGCNYSLHNTTDFVYGITSSENYFTMNNISGVVPLAINACDLPGDGSHSAIIATASIIIMIAQALYNLL